MSLLSSDSSSAAAPARFVGQKLTLVVEAILRGGSPSAAQVERMFRQRIDRAATGGSHRLAELKGHDRSIDDLATVALGVRGYRQIKTELRREFGYSRLGDDFDSVAKRVLARGAARSEDEVEILINALSNVENIRQLGEGRYLQLQRLVSEWRPQPIKRKPKK